MLPSNRSTSFARACVVLVLALQAGAAAATAPGVNSANKGKKPVPAKAAKAEPAKPVEPAEPAQPELATLGLIDGESDAMTTAVTIRLDRKPAWETPAPLVDHGTFLQLTLPGTLAPEPGRFFDGVGPYIKKIAVLQQTPSDAAVRLFVDKDAAKAREAADVALLDKRLVLTLDHRKLEPTAESIIAATEVEKDIPPPSEMLKAEAAAPIGALAGSGLQSFDLRDKLMKVTAFSGIMILLLIGSFLLRPYLRRRNAARQGEDAAPISMRTLATLPLAARQKISLIQVGDEKILIGVTPENVSFLTAIGSSQGAARSHATLAPQLKAGFTRLLGDDDAATLDLQRKPMLKDLPGNDEVSLREPAQAKAAAVAAPAAQPRRPSAEGRPVLPRQQTALATQAAAVAEPAAKPAPRRAAAAQGSRINVAVGDDGVQQLPPARPAARKASAPAAAPANGEEGQKAIEDVTRLIREKLKTLRTL